MYISFDLEREDGGGAERIARREAGRGSGRRWIFRDMMRRSVCRGVVVVVGGAGGMEMRFVVVWCYRMVDGVGEVLWFRFVSSRLVCSLESD